MSPIIGALSSVRSRKSRNFSERLYTALKVKALAKMAKTKMNHHSCRPRDMFTTTWVNAGSSAPKPWNTLSNCGTTLISRIAVTITATMITAIG
ncbi:hypothetical protein D9M68_873310 [compost metagenome]